MSTFYTQVSHLQDLVDNVYTVENQRLQNRKQGINDMMNSQKRLIALNHSYTSKMKKYGFIIGIISFSLVFTVMIVAFQNVIPSFIASLGIIIVITGALIWSYLIYTDIRKRDRLDFDELATDSSALMNTANINKTNTDDTQFNISDAIANTNTCSGRTCCPTDWGNTMVANTLYFNTNINKCCINKSVASEQPTGTDDGNCPT
jgi:hypothetical protein